MCMMSVLTQYGRDRVADTAWTPQSWQQFKDITGQVEKLDTDLGEPDCVDPEKAAWMQRIEERIERIEANAFRNAFQ